MSYILDALRRADSERERGAIPGIGAQPVPPTSADFESRPAAPRPWLWFMVGLALACTAMLGWFVFGRAEPFPLLQDGPGPVAPAADVVPQLVPPQAAPAAPAPSLRPVPVVALEPAAEAVPADVALANPARAARTESGLASAGPQPTPETAASTATASDGRIQARHELPEEVQRELPALVIGGSVYSEHPPDRVLIVNGRVFHEGDTMGAMLSLERIKLKSAVLKYGEHRYEVSF